MSFREKLLDFKRRLSDRKMYSIVVVVIAAVAIFGVYQYKKASELRQQLDNQYNRAFYDMTGYVNNVDVLLVKSLVSASPAKTASTLQEAWRQATLAQTNLGQLPVSQQTLANTSKFLTQVGDFSLTLDNQNIQGKSLSDAQYNTLENLHKYAVNLSKSLNDLQTQLNSGRLKWGELTRKGTPLFSKTSTNLTKQSFENLDKTFQDYPSLIYDGPFSDNLADIAAKGVTGDKINQEQGKDSVRKFFGDNRIKDIKIDGKNDSGPISTYRYVVTLKDSPKGVTARLDITQTGGHPYSMLYPRPSNADKITMDQAKEIGRKFLEDQGFKGMRDTYYLKEDNTATINYAYKQDNVTVYPDLIKVKVALDNGEIVGFEGKGYLSSHTVRNIPAPKITEEKARSMVNRRVKLQSVDLAIIPTQFKTEMYVYELKCRLNDSDFLVYINALTGAEENILMIVNTPNGVLTL